MRIERRTTHAGDPWLRLAPQGLAALADEARARTIEPIALALSLGGPLPERLRVHARDVRLGRAERGAALLAGKLDLAGARLETHGAQPWTSAPPGSRLAAALQAFDWLKDLTAHASAGDANAARSLAQRYTDGWIDAHSDYSDPAWRPAIVGRRIIAWLTNAALLTTDTDLIWRSKLYHSLGWQARYLARVTPFMQAGPARLSALTGIALAALCLGETPSRTQRAARDLAGEVKRILLPDGGHKNRSPASHLDLLADLVMVREAFAAAVTPMPKELEDAIDGMMPMLRFFHAGGGALVAFHGSGAEDPSTVNAVLAADRTGTKPLACAPHMGFHRLSAGETQIIADAGRAPSVGLADEAHAGYLAFELVRAGRRVVINCGRAPAADPYEERVARSTAAHSTLSLGESSSARILNGSLAGRLLGPKLVAGPSRVESRRHDEIAAGYGGHWLEMSHDGYAGEFGRRHTRRIYLQERGEDVRGEDRIEPAPGETMVPSVPFRLRFHIHPDVRVALVNGENAARLALPGGEVWRFQARGGEVTLAESLCYGPAGAAATKQIVLRGEAALEAVTRQWAFRREGDDARKG